MEYSNLFVCLMGICTVFIGLICIIILVSIMSGIVRKTTKQPDSGNAQMPNASAPALAAAQPAALQGAQVTPEMVAAVSAVIAQELGTGVDAIRILSFKKV